MTTIIGLDIGTAGCRAVVFDEDGTRLALASREYPVDLPQPHHAEQDIELVWERSIEALREAIVSARVGDVAAIGLSVHGEAVTAVGEDGRPLRPTILGMDTRTDQENDWLRARFGGRWLFERTGMPIHTINTLPKLLWLRTHEADVWRRTRRFLLVEDFFIQRLTGQAVTSSCLASRTQLHDLRRGGWDAEILDAIGLDAGRLAEVRPSGTTVGHVLPALTERLGLARPPVVVTGGHDQACGALGVGLTSPGLAAVSTGTAEVAEVALDSPNVSEPLYEGNISVYQHTVPGMYLAMTLNHSGGLALRWFRDRFCEPQQQRATAEGRDAYDLVLAEASPGPSGLLVLPHFSGSGTPTFDTRSRAAILGLTFSTSRGDIAKAILEGITYELRLNLELLQAGGVAVDVLRAIGGGARSPLWLQLKADITGIPVVVPASTEAAAFGAALLAGVGVGLYASPAQAADGFLDLSDTYVPDAARHTAYTALFDAYRDVYPAVAPILHRLW